MSSSPIRATGPGTRAPLYRGLRPRRNGPAHEQVCAHQRARLCAATVEAVAERGYAATTVRELAGLAGVSTRTLYELVQGKQGCVLAAHDFVVQRAARRVAAAQEGEQDWRVRLGLAFEAFAREIAGEPKAARLVLMEAYAVGPASHAHVEHANRLFEGMLNTSFRRAPDGLAAPAFVVKGIVSGIARVARARLLDGSADQLPELADELLEWALCLRSPAATVLARAEGCCSALPCEAVEDLAGGERIEFVGRDDRARILQVATELAVTRGCRHLAVAEVAAHAGVSRRTFGRHFESVEECLLAACELVHRQVIEHAAKLGLERGDWSRCVSYGVDGLLRLLAENPALAQLAFVEVLTLGPAGIESTERLLARWAALLRTPTAAHTQRPSQLEADASVGAAWGMLHHHLAHGMSRRLPHLVGPLSFLVLAPALGAPRAAQGILAAHVDR